MGRERGEAGFLFCPTPNFCITARNGRLEEEKNSEMPSDTRKSFNLHTKTASSHYETMGITAEWHRKCVTYIRRDERLEHGGNDTSADAGD